MNSPNHSSLPGLLATAGLAALLFSACNPAVGETRAPDTTPVLKGIALATVSHIQVPRLLTLSGSLVGDEQAKVAAGASGKIVATYIERGQMVKKGTVLARLDDRAASAQAQETAAQFESLKVQWTQSDRDCSRTQQMFDKGAISQAEYDRSHTQCDASKWSLSAAQARKELTAEALQDTRIRAPFDGMVVERNVSPGEYVRPDSPIVSLVDVDNLRLELTVPETALIQVREGMKVEFRTASQSTKRSYQGKVRYIGPSVRQNSRDAVVEAIVLNVTHELRPGMFVTATLSLGEESVPGVPESAVRVIGTERRVFVNIEGRLEERLVQVGETRQGLIPVLDGLKKGEQIVAQLSPNIRDGARLVN